MELVVHYVASVVHAEAAKVLGSGRFRHVQTVRYVPHRQTRSGAPR